MNARLVSLSDQGRRRLNAWMRSRVAWLTDARRDLSDTLTPGFALVLVLGREHYTERRKLYPVRGLRDLSRVLKHEFAAAPETLWLIGPLAGDQRRVVVYAPKPGTAERIGKALWIVPESAVLGRGLRSGAVVVVDRNGFRYHLAESGESQPAGGAIPTAALFAMAIGSGEALAPETWDGATVRSRLLPGLRQLPLAAWVGFFRPTARPFATVAWKRIGVVLAALVFGYLGLASAYLAVLQTSRERALLALGPRVGQLLDAQRQIEALAAEQRALGALLDGRLETYELWRLAALAWQHGARLTGAQIADGKLTLRGSAPTATEVLAQLASAPGVREARFAAPVQHSLAGEDFAITLTLGAPRG